MVKKVLTIAGSDSFGGAGIQADMKTFSALGVYGASVITVVTAQNSKTISDIFVIPPDFFKNQLISTIEDLQPNVIKIGVVYDKNIINIIYDTLKEFAIPIVVDPVLYSGTGIELLKKNNYSLFKDKIIPLSSIVTPNIYEAETLTHTKIITDNDMTVAASKLVSLGAQNVIIKGGHTKNPNKVVDFLFEKEKNKVFNIARDRIKIGITHGSGCNFSSSLTAFLAKGYSIYECFILANSFVYQGLREAQKIGNGISITNPIYHLYSQSEKFKTLIGLQRAVEYLQEMSNFYLLLPETKTNFVYSLENPSDLNDVAGIKGRLTNIGNKIRSPNVVEFGVSKHVAKAVIAANKHKILYRSAINISNTKEILRICKDHFICSSYSRTEEPSGIKEREGQTILWGVDIAFRKNPNTQVVYHHGDYGKEPMIIIFGKDPQEVIDIISFILKRLS